MPYPLRQRTPFARWMWERGVKPQDLEGDLARSWESIRRYALDFDDPQRRIPDEPTLDRIFTLTEGEIGPGSFYPPRFGPGDRGGDETVLVGARAQ